MEQFINIFMTIICFLVGIVLGGFLARKRVISNWTLNQELRWWIELILGKGR